MKEYFKRYKAMSGKFRGKDIVTVCTILDDKEKRGRGVAVCSPTDIPDEKSGEFWARCYAERAIKRRPDIPITDYRAIRTVLHTDCPFIMQSEMHPQLTFHEIAFFFGKKNIKEYIGV